MNTHVPKFNEKFDGYKLIEHVAILDTFEDDELTVDEARLQRIAANANKRFSDTLDAVPLVLGHTDEALPESAQPPIVGYAINFQLGTLGEVEPRPALFVDFLIDPKFDGVEKQYPRRSVELWEDDIVDPIALLGATTPRRALGLLSKNGSRRDKRSTRFELMSEEQMADDTQNNDDVVKAVLDAFESSPMGKYLKAKMEADAEQPQDDEPADDDATKNENGDEDAPADKAKMGKGKKAKDAIRLERDQLAMNLSKAERENAKLAKEVAEIQTKLRRGDREASLKQLAYEGYSFDLVEELDYVEDMSDDRFEKHVGKIKTRYSRSPRGASPISPVALAMPTDKSAEGKKAKGEAAKAYALAHKCSYKEALTKV
jgi:hypothetical protein